MIKKLKKILIISCLTFLPLAFAAPAQAHVDISSTSPADGSVTPTAPRESILTFAGIVDPASVTLKLEDINGNKLAAPKVLGDGGPATIVKFSLPELPNNTYVITYRENSSDGHTIEGQITFTVGPAPLVAPTGKIFHQSLFGRNMEIIARFIFDTGGYLLVGSLFWWGLLQPRTYKPGKSREIRKNVLLNYETKESRSRDATLKLLILLSTSIMGWGAFMRLSSYLIQYLPGSTTEAKYALIGSRSLWSLIGGVALAIIVNKIITKGVEVKKSIAIITSLLVVSLYFLGLVSHAGDQAKPYLDALIWATHVSMAFVWVGPVVVGSLLWFLPGKKKIEREEALYGFSEYATLGIFSVFFATATGLAQAYVYSGNNIPTGDYRNILISKIILIILAGILGLKHNINIKKGKIGKGGSFKWEIILLVSVVSFAALLAITSPLSA